MRPRQWRCRCRFRPLRLPLRRPRSRLQEHASTSLMERRRCLHTQRTLHRHTAAHKRMHCPEPASCVGCLVPTKVAWAVASVAAAAQAASAAVAEGRVPAEAGGEAMQPRRPRHLLRWTLRPWLRNPRRATRRFRRWPRTMSRVWRVRAAPPTILARAPSATCCCAWAATTSILPRVRREWCMLRCAAASALLEAYRSRALPGEWCRSATAGCGCSM